MFGDNVVIQSIKTLISVEADPCVVIVNGIIGIVCGEVRRDFAVNNHKILEFSISIIGQCSGCLLTADFSCNGYHYFVYGIIQIIIVIAVSIFRREKDHAEIFCGLECCIFVICDICFDKILCFMFHLGKGFIIDFGNSSNSFCKTRNGKGFGCV